MFHLTAGEPVADGVREIADDQLGTALAEIDDNEDRHDAVHEVRKRCKKVRGLMRLVRDDPSSHVWHQWRKRVKYHRYHGDILREAWLPVMEQREDLLRDLTDHLGDDHDLAELRTALVDDQVVDLRDEVLAGYVELIDERRTQLQHQALPLAARLFAATVDEHCDLVFGWWQRAVDDHAAEVEAVTDVPHDEPVIPAGT